MSLILTHGGPEKTRTGQGMHRPKGNMLSLGGGWETEGPQPLLNNILEQSHATMSPLNASQAQSCLAVKLQGNQATAFTLPVTVAETPMICHPRVMVYLLYRGLFCRSLPEHSCAIRRCASGWLQS
ncbi:hypothetical protein KIL84_011948 [Mauremys mutica]|uniref:Uncharacterized protein n=1 Tax=Mauremys mutica TaxID=74926 RepID=A0A9D4B2S1_9SAUR|nr:hypothetical protein KIL84_011948 [Mauremys mutica]